MKIILEDLKNNKKGLEISQDSYENKKIIIAMMVCLVLVKVQLPIIG